MDVDKIVITNEDLEKLGTPSAPPLQNPNPFPIGWRLASLLLILVPPFLLLVCLVSLLSTRNREISTRHTFAIHWCVLLLVCGFLWSIAIGITAWRVQRNQIPVLVEEGNTSISYDSFPQLPSETELTGKEIAADMSQLVVAISGGPVSSADQKPLAQGAGVITYADNVGFLVLTCRHVLGGNDSSSKFGRVVRVELHDGQRTVATVVGVHNSLDLALLWVEKNSGENVFLQPLVPYESVEVGEQVFAIGHPEGLAFSISSGLVAQKRDGNFLQISAPISLGNSGGPVYDAHGRLIGVVQSVFDKSMEPNAENLNFAVRVDDLLNAGAWALSEQGRSAVEGSLSISAHDGTAGPVPDDNGHNNSENKLGGQ